MGIALRAFAGAKPFGSEHRRGLEIVWTVCGLNNRRLSLLSFLRFSEKVAGNCSEAT